MLGFVSDPATIGFRLVPQLPLFFLCVPDAISLSNAMTRPNVIFDFPFPFLFQVALAGAQVLKANSTDPEANVKSTVKNASSESFGTCLFSIYLAKKTSIATSLECMLLSRLLQPASRARYDHQVLLQLSSQVLWVVWTEAKWSDAVER